MAESHQRKNIGTRLVQQMFKLFADEEIRWGGPLFLFHHLPGSRPSLMELKRLEADLLVVLQDCDLRHAAGEHAGHPLHAEAGLRRPRLPRTSHWTAVCVTRCPHTTYLHLCLPA